MVEVSRYYKQSNVITFDSKYTLYPKSELDKKVEIACDAFQKHIMINHLWSVKHVLCETLNLVNVLAQVWSTNRFLGGRFYRLGVDFIEEDFSGTMDVLDTIFPKVTKCHFHKYGPSGTIQKHDALCVMALNVINEKIFTFLWFWYAIIIFVSVIALIWRIITFFCYSRYCHNNGYISFLYLCVIIFLDLLASTVSFFLAFVLEC